MPKKKEKVKPPFFTNSRMREGCKDFKYIRKINTNLTVGYSRKYTLLNYYNKIF